MNTTELTISKGWVAQHTESIFDRRYYLDPFYRRDVDRRGQNAADAVFPGMEVFFSESNLGRRRYHHFSHALVGGIQPNMILGMLLGAEFLPVEERDADIAPAPWRDRPVETLPQPQSLLAHEMIRLFDQQIEAVNRREGCVAIPPFFWDGSGRAAIHGVLTTAQKLVGESVFMDLCDDPEKTVRLLNWIADGFIELIRHFSEKQSSGLDLLHIGECSSCMVGPGPYAEHILPVIGRIGQALGCPIRLHSCGPSDHLLDAFQTLPNLASLDLGGETSVKHVRERFGSKFPVSIAPPVGMISSSDMSAVCGWVRRVREENNEGDLTFLLHIEAEYPIETVRAFYRETEV